MRKTNMVISIIVNSLMLIIFAAFGIYFLSSGKILLSVCSFAFVLCFAGGIVFQIRKKKKDSNDKPDKSA